MNGLIVIDADNHGGEDGVAAFAVLCSAQPWEPPFLIPCVRTPRNGAHWYFKRRSDLGNTKSQLAPAIDVRDNAYVIAPGTKMANGGAYQPIAFSVEQLAFAIATNQLPELPAWLRNVIVRPVDEMLRRQRREASYTGSVPQLAGLLRAVAFAPHGKRNNLLYWAAKRFGEAVGAGAISVENAFYMLSEAARHAGLSQHEMSRTILSGLSNGFESASNER
jgi:hypothetical protein